MAFDIPAAVGEVLLGASITQIAAAYREQLIAEFGFRQDEITADTFRGEAASFLRKLARELADGDETFGAKMDAEIKQGLARRR